ncbi:hypothetical protein ABT063_32695 [Streptomyces sp. NPDC002838]|uniref:hypothetical protein n=1 Tax=Streptomyces sp. NPDC002838 TaxID=3154436 RepID=UPI00331FA682
MAAKPLRLTARWGLLGAVGGLIASALMVGSGALLTLFWSETTSLAVLGSAIGMATVVCWPTVILRLLSWHVAATAVVQFALMMTVAVLFGDAVLDQRGVRVTAVVSETREITQKDGGTGHVCQLRLPDGTSSEPTGWDTGCDADTEVGDHFTVHQDPEGLIPPQRSLLVTAPQYACFVGAGVTTLVTLGALTGIHAARHRSQDG